MKQIVGHYFWGILAFLAVVALFGLAAMFLWNALLPDIFGLPEINYWQAAGMLLLARIVFGGYGEIGRGMKRGFHGRKNPLLDRWHSMSEEERNAFIKRHGGSFPHGHAHYPFCDDSGKQSETEKKE
jgi:hypothetical protein